MINRNASTNCMTHVKPHTVTCAQYATSTTLLTRKMTSNNHIQTLAFKSRMRLKCDGTRADFVFRRNGRVHLNRRGASVQSTTGSRGVRMGGSNAGYTMFPGSVKGTGYPLNSPVSPSISLPCVTVCHHISAGVYRYAVLNKDTFWEMRRSAICANVTECTYTNLYSIAYYTTSLYTAFCS